MFEIIYPNFLENEIRMAEIQLKTQWPGTEYYRWRGAPGGGPDSSVSDSASDTEQSSDGHSSSDTGGEETEGADGDHDASFADEDQSRLWAQWEWGAAPSCREHEDEDEDGARGQRTAPGTVPSGLWRGASLDEPGHDDQRVGKVGKIGGNKPQSANSQEKLERLYAAREAWSAEGLYDVQILAAGLGNNLNYDLNNLMPVAMDDGGASGAPRKCCLRRCVGGCCGAIERQLDAYPRFLIVLTIFINTLWAHVICLSVFTHLSWEAKQVGTIFFVWSGLWTTTGAADYRHRAARVILAECCLALHCTPADLGFTGTF